MAGNKTRKTSKGMTWRGFYAMLRSLTFIHLVMGISSDLDKFYEQDAHILNPGSGLLFIFLKLKKSPGDSIWNQKGEPFEPWNSGNPPWILNDRKSQGALDTASFIHSFSYSFVYLIIQWTLYPGMWGPGKQGMRQKSLLQWGLEFSSEYTHIHRLLGRVGNMWTEP